jgi:hypothetical protein
MTTDEFRNYIAQKIQFAQELLQDKQLKRVVAEKGLNMEDVVFNQLDRAFTEDWHKFRAL